MRMILLGLCIIFAFSCRAPLDEIELEPLLIESGDLPAGVSGSQVSALNQEFSGRGVPSPCNYISQDLAYQGEVIGDVSVLVFEEEQDAEAAYQTLREDYNSLQLMNDCSELIEEYRTVYWNGEVWRSGVSAFAQGWFDDIAYWDQNSQDAFHALSQNMQIVLYMSDIKESYRDFNNVNEYMSQYREFLSKLSGGDSIVNLRTVTTGLDATTAEDQFTARDELARIGFEGSYIQIDQLQRDFIEDYIQRTDVSGDWSGPHDEIVKIARQAVLDAVDNVSFWPARYSTEIERAISHEEVTQGQFATYSAYQIAVMDGDEELALELQDELGLERFGAAQSAFMRFQSTASLGGGIAAVAGTASAAMASIARAAAEAGIEDQSEDIFHYLISNGGSLRGYDLGDGADSNSALSRASRGNISTRNLVEELEISSMLEDHTIGETHEMDTHGLGDMAVSSIVEVTVNPLQLQSIELLCKTGHAVFLIRAMSENGSFSLDDMLNYGDRLSTRLEPHVSD